MNIGILENDFGAVNVDMMLLQESRGRAVRAGDGVRRLRSRDSTVQKSFKTKLIAMGMCGYDRVIVEPSGIFDIDEFFDVLHEENRWISGMRSAM